MGLTKKILWFLAFFYAIANPVFGMPILAVSLFVHYIRKDRKKASEARLSASKAPT